MKNIPATIFPKIPKISVEFQANFQLLGTKKRGRLTSFFCILLRLETECTAQTEAAETIAPAII